MQRKLSMATIIATTLTLLVSANAQSGPVISGSGTTYRGGGVNPNPPQQPSSDYSVSNSSASAPSPPPNGNLGGASPAVPNSPPLRYVPPPRTVGH